MPVLFYQRTIHGMVRRSRSPPASVKLIAAWSDEGELRCNFIIRLLKHKNDDINPEGLQPIYDL